MVRLHSHHALTTRYILYMLYEIKCYCQFTVFENEFALLQFLLRPVKVDLAAGFFFRLHANDDCHL